MRGTRLLLCARAASGHETAPPPTTLMKSRLLTAFPPKLNEFQPRHWHTPGNETSTNITQVSKNPFANLLRRTVRTWPPKSAIRICTELTKAGLRLTSAFGNSAPVARTRAHSRSGGPSTSLMSGIWVRFRVEMQMASPGRCGPRRPCGGAAPGRASAPSSCPGLDLAEDPHDAIAYHDLDVAGQQGCRLHSRARCDDDRRKRRLALGRSVGARPRAARRRWRRRGHLTHSSTPLRSQR